MLDPMTQGLPNQAPAAPPEAPQGTPGSEPAAIPGQSLPEPAQSEGQPEATDSAKHFQSLYNRELAQRLALERQMQDFQQRQDQPLSPSPVPDPNQDWVGWMDYKLKEQRREIAHEQQENFQRLIVAAEEGTWAQKHPEVDLQTVKNFAAVRGVRLLDDAYTLLTMPQMMQNVAGNVAQQSISQFQRPQNQAAPLRGTPPGGPQQTQLRYDELAKQFVESNGRVYTQWPTELQRAFDQETAMRDAAKRQR